MNSVVITLIGFGCVFVLFNLADLLKYKFIDVKQIFDDKMAFKRLYASCQRKWDNPKNIALRKEYGSFRQYFDIEYDKKFRWKNVYEEKFYE